MAEEITNKTVAEFFAGIGLMRAGLEIAGWTVTFANDIDPTKRKLYLHHFETAGEHFHLGDIHKLCAANIPTVSLATASFPCTDLSLAGRRAGLKGENSSAFWGFVKILQQMGDRKPALVLLENVTGFLTSNNGQDFSDALIALNGLGYSVDTFIINAIHFVPQSRIRLFIVAKIIEESLPITNYDLSKTELRPPKLVNFIQNNPNIRWDINQTLPELPLLENKLESIVEPLPKSSKLWWSNDRKEYLLNQTFERHLLKVLELKKANTYTYLTAFRRIRNGHSMAEIRFDGIAGCLRTPKGGSARQILLQVGKNEINIRLLTPTECARLMGASDFKLSGTANEALFGFGDAVCVPVVEWIAENYLNPALINILIRNELRLETYAATA